MAVNVFLQVYFFETAYCIASYLHTTHTQRRFFHGAIHATVAQVAHPMRSPPAKPYYENFPELIRVRVIREPGPEPPGQGRQHVYARIALTFLDLYD